VTATDSNGATSSKTFALVINGPLTASQAVASMVLTNGTAATSFTPVTGFGGTAPLSYTVSPGLPSGLSMSSSTGAITGTPSVTSSAATYTVTVTDSASVTATNTFSHTALSGLNFFIACDPGDKSSRAFNGKIATAMVYNAALSQADITSVFNAQKAAFDL
jgi:hypothetical protein